MNARKLTIADEWDLRLTWCILLSWSVVLEHDSANVGRPCLINYREQGIHNLPHLQETPYRACSPHCTHPWQDYETIPFARLLD